MSDQSRNKVVWFMIAMNIMVLVAAGMFAFGAVDATMVKAAGASPLMTLFILSTFLNGWFWILVE
jgi:hypothetical protein